MQRLCGALFVLLLFGAASPSGVSAKQHSTAQEFSSSIPPLLATATPAFESLAAITRGGERFPQGAHLLRIQNGKAELLLPQFFASADANVSFDGKTMLFAGKKEYGDHWQVWELNLADGSTRKAIAADTDLVRPVYLPENRLVYARRGPAGFQLETASMDGTRTVQLTHTLTSALPVDVLEDGRILFESTFPLGADGKPELYLVYSDGSGVESYRCDHGKARWGGHQLRTGPEAGDVVFTHGTSLARFTSPLATETPVLAPVGEYDSALADTASGNWVVSARIRNDERFALMLLAPRSHTLRLIYADSQNQLVEPVVLAPRSIPNRHPSGLHLWPTANLLALDVRLSREGDLKVSPTQVRLETQDTAGRPVLLGLAPIAQDGSFYAKVPGDRPLRFSLLDRNGAVVRAERGWFWARGGEQRICVGCHTGPERAPDNRVPQILLRSTIPTDLSGSKPGSTAGGH